MAVGTLATVKALDPRRPARDGRADDPRQRVPSAPAARRRAHSRAGRTARVHALGWPDPHRLGRLPGLLARERCAPSSEDGVEFRSHIDGSQRALHARERDADRAQPRRRRDHAVRSRHPRPERGRRRARRERAKPALARALPRRVRAARARGPDPRTARAGALSDRAGRHSRRPAPRGGRGDPRHGRLGGFRHRRALGRRGEAGHVPHPRGRRRRCCPRDRPRYLMGVGFPEDLVEGVRRGVDLFDCVAPTRMGRNGAAFTRDGRLNIKRAEFRTDRGRSTRSATARRAAASRAPTSAISSSPTRSSAFACSPCTMYISSSR